MSTNYNPSIVTDGLVLYLDAANKKSYPGSGNTWYDLSGNGRHYSIGSNITWNSKGCFDVNYGTFTGPASNTFGFNEYCEHHIEAWIMSPGNLVGGTTLFWWYATANSGTDTRGISGHCPWGTDYIIYDTAGCCDWGSQRLLTTAYTASWTAPQCFQFRTRANETPYRNLYANCVSLTDSSTSPLYTSTWNLTSPATLCSWWSGSLYSIRVYNRPLSEAEMARNFQASRGRFNL